MRYMQKIEGEVDKLKEKQRREQRKYILTAGLFVIFIVYTILVMTVDRQQIGPNNSEVGFASVNLAVFQSLGRSDFWYSLTEYIGYIAILVVFAFAIVGLFQMIQRKNFFRTDLEILVLGGFYVLLVAIYVFFEKVIINYRPVLEEGKLEASYPSSHTMLVCCVMATAIIQFDRMIKNQTIRILADIAAVSMIALMVMGRLLSGVHWLTDIIGGVIISAALVMLYLSVVHMLREKIRRKIAKRQAERNAG